MVQELHGAQETVDAGSGDSGCWSRRQWMVQELHGVQETVDDGPGDSGRSRSCILLVTEKSTSNDAF